MANYCGVARTNYVTVDDVEGLKKALEPWPIKVITNAAGQVGFLDDDPDGCGWPSWACDDDGNELDLDVAEVIMPFVKEGEVLVLKESGHEKMQYVTGWSTAWVRRGNDVQYVQLSLNDIYRLAADKFGVAKKSISAAEY